MLLGQRVNTDFKIEFMFNITPLSMSQHEFTTRFQ